MTTDSSSVATPPNRSERVLGAVMGALLGDALGVPVEFTTREQRDVLPVKGPQGGGTWKQPPGTWSDDGALLLCTLDAFADGAGIPGAADRFVRWRNEGLWTACGTVFDIGSTTSSALDRLEAGATPLSAGPTDERANGNGSLMRILPVALRFADAPRDELISQARDFSRITHGHARSQISCAVYCVVAAALVRGVTPAEAYAQGLAALRELIHETPSEATAFGRLLDGSLPSLARSEINSGGYVVETLEAAFWCLLRYETFPETVLAAINLGGDTDTTGCVAGGLAGAWYGMSALPNAWLAVLPRRSELEMLVEQGLLW